MQQNHVCVDHHKLLEPPPAQAAFPGVYLVPVPSAPRPTEMWNILSLLLLPCAGLNPGAPGTSADWDTTFAQFCSR